MKQEELMFIPTVKCNHCNGKGTCRQLKKKAFSLAKYSCSKCVENAGFDSKEFHIVPCSVCKGVGNLTREKFKELYKSDKDDK